MKTNNMKLKKIGRGLGGIFFAAVIIASGVFGMSAKAEETPREFPKLEPKGSINVTMKTAEGEAVGGGTLEAYKIAKVTVDGFKFEYIAPFDGLKKPIAEDADLTSELAQAAEALITDNVKPVATQTIDTSGNASFSGQDLGLYLVRQTQAADGYEPVSSFLVTIPYYDEAVKTEDGKWVKAQYDVDASPKVEKVKKKNPTLKPCKANPRVRKVVWRKSAPLNQEFQFEFKRLNSAFPMPVNADGKQVSLSGDVQILKVTTTGKDADGYPTGIAEGGEITFDKIGDYRYTYREINDGKYRYIYSNDVFYITYHVKAGTGEYADSLVIDSVETWMGRVDGTPYKDTPYKPSADDPNFSDPTYAGPDVVEFVFYNEPGGGGGDRDERTPRDPSNPGTTPPQVLGENRDPDSGVLGADRMPEQAVLGADRLPQTGQLWWPVPILLICGFALIGGGFFGRRKEK